MVNGRTMYLEHLDTARLERAEQASTFLCEHFRHDLGSELWARLDRFHADVTAAIVRRATDRARNQQCQTA
jgi:hypothetical protein